VQLHYLFHGFSVVTWDGGLHIHVGVLRIEGRACAFACYVASHMVSAVASASNAHTSNLR
jgi:hypothetical protein